MDAVLSHSVLAHSGQAKPGCRQHSLAHEDACEAVSEAAATVLQGSHLPASEQ